MIIVGRPGWDRTALQFPSIHQSILGELLIAVTSLGIVGLASFSVNRRTKQIGTRRALGASKFAIQRYFMTENFIISLVGVLIGAALTIGLNIVMIETFSLTRIAWYTGYIHILREHFHIIVPI